MNFSQPFFTILIICGTVFLILGWILRNKPPKSINYYFGYRTSSAMKSKDRWDFAQSYSGKLLTNSGGALVVFAIISLFFEIPETAGNIIGTVLTVLVIFIIIFKVERALRNNFNQEG
ncbi:SdpI family protein [Membranihabitans maritimus]|uniref:SdpI family protein n=1 Tax=Membranihabitans maritimus TaxID=2904244 RepID=UPI001F45B3DD|nr:SdpI family protein [Membranihabitans maritimus]